MAAGPAVLVLANSMSLRDIVNAQSGSLFGAIPQFRWFVFFQPVGFLIFFTAKWRTNNIGQNLVRSPIIFAMIQ